MPDAGCGHHRQREQRGPRLGHRDRVPGAFPGRSERPAALPRFRHARLEPEYIIETSRHAGIVHNYLVTARRRPTDADIERQLAAVGYPEEAGSAMAGIPFFEDCRRHGIGTLFSGFGGDEGVTNSGSLLARPRTARPSGV